MTLPAFKTEPCKTEIAVNLDKRTLRELKSFIEDSDLDATFTREEILAHFRDVHGIEDSEIAFLIAGEYFLCFSDEDQRKEIAAFMLKRNPRLVLSE